ncbi:hypothetical protein [Natronococcus jeotgali]|uniref:hypothetical protein n=1 Tax=Natronococcus jeotgali TaxID=413812 RepID=UPI000677E0FC|nr:hypothetical protein [Natronococcus jeotgali]
MTPDEDRKNGSDAGQRERAAAVDAVVDSSASPFGETSTPSRRPNSSSRASSRSRSRPRAGPRKSGAGTTETSAASAIRPTSL